MTAIADLVTLLLSTGIPPESVSAAINLAHHHALEQVDIHRISGGIPPESAAEKRKAWDRERKRKIAENKKTPLILTSSSLLSGEILSEERKKESSGIRARARKKLGPLPENWQPPDIAYALATECGTTVPQVEAIFRDYLKSSGKLYADHDAAFCNFVRNQRKFNGQNHNGKDNGKAKYGIMEAADSLRRKVASFDGPASEDISLRDGARPAVAGLLPQRRG